MAEDLYGSADEPTGPETPTPEAEDDSTKKTAVIDAAICPGMKPGEEMVVKIEKVTGSEYVVSYAPEPGDEEQSSEESPAREAEATGEPAMSGGGGMYE